MSRPLSLLIAAAVIASTPVGALAQAWPSTVVASAPRMTNPTRVPALNLEREVARGRATGHLPASADRRVLTLNPSREPDDVPKVELRAKPAWSDDEGFRVGLNRVAYKRRF